MAMRQVRLDLSTDLDLTSGELERQGRIESGPQPTTLVGRSWRRGQRTQHKPALRQQGLQDESLVEPQAPVSSLPLDRIGRPVNQPKRIVIRKEQLFLSHV
jgi:hypothetical protein